MIKNFLAIGLLISINLNAQKFTSYVNPLIGTAKNGHTFPGPTRPHALVQLSPDNKLNDWSHCSGYHFSDSIMLGFSHSHLNGTGIGDLGDVLISPSVGMVFYENGLNSNIDKGYAFRFSHKKEDARVGYYKVWNLDDSVQVELTSSHRVGFHKYTFPKTNQANLVIDLGSTIYDESRKNIIESQVEVIDQRTVQGYKILKGWAPLRKVYFYIQFSRAFDVNAIYEGKPKQGGRFFRGNEGIVSSYTFKNINPEPLLVKVAISFVSIENAKLNATEILSWKFEDVVAQSEEEWDKELSKIQIEGTTKQKEIFYTGLYHTLIQPNNISDINGDYYGSDYKIHNSNSKTYYSTFSLWDTYRSVHPLYTLINPSRVAEMANTMIAHFNQNGYLPIWSLGGTETHCMVGNHSIPVLADAILKGISGFDHQKAYQAMKASSTNDHKDSPWNKNKYVERGYMAYGIDWQDPTKTLDFSFDDWCVAQVAKKLGDNADYEYFIKRSKFYKNQFNNKTGLTWPRDTSGKFKENFNPKLVQWDADFTEGNAWQYNFLVQHDPKGLIELYPSIEKFREKLDSFFIKTNVPNSTMADVEIGDFGQYIHSNEPSHHIGYFYNYINEPWRTQSFINKIIKSQYNNTPDGICGNEDCGQMSAWYVWNAMGLYPMNPASGNYDFGCPQLKKAIIQLENTKTFTILAPKASDKNIYIQAIKLNGKPYQKLYISHADIIKGGILEFEMGEKPNKSLSNYELPKLQ